jgi:mono/diheme cytochrome c family protein
MKNILFLLFVPLLLVAGKVQKSSAFLEGKRIYNETCASCHGKNGETNPAMQLIVKPRILKKSILSQEQMLKMISDGAHVWGAHSDIMPAFKFVYEEEQIDSIALYVTEEFNANRKQKVAKLLKESENSTLDEEKMLKVGKKIFKRSCSLCHGITGNGESIYVEQSKENKQFLYPYNLNKILLDEDQIFLYAKFGGHFWGTDKEDMPSWKKKYNDVKLQSVAKYIYQKIKHIRE